MGKTPEFGFLEFRLTGLKENGFCLWVETIVDSPFSRQLRRITQIAKGYRINIPSYIDDNGVVEFRIPQTVVINCMDQWFSLGLPIFDVTAPIRRIGIKITPVLPQTLPFLPQWRSSVQNKYNQ